MSSSLLQSRRLSSSLWSEHTSDQNAMAQVKDKMEVSGSGWGAARWAQPRTHTCFLETLSELWEERRAGKLP